MKAFYALIFILILASCSNTNLSQEQDINLNSNEISEISAEEKTIDDINTQIDNLDTNNDSNENKVIKLDARYENPNTEVDMVISYTLDEAGKIEMIEASATTFDVSHFNDSIQFLVGKTMDEAKTANIAGASLTTEAFKNALK